MLRNGPRNAFACSTMWFMAAAADPWTHRSQQDVLDVARALRPALPADLPADLRVKDAVGAA